MNDLVLNDPVLEQEVTKIEKETQTEKETSTEKEKETEVVQVYNFTTNIKK